MEATIRWVAATSSAGFDFTACSTLVAGSRSQVKHCSLLDGAEGVTWTPKSKAAFPGENSYPFDGKIVARHGCGNRIALTPLGPPAMMKPAGSRSQSTHFANDPIGDASSRFPQARGYGGRLFDGCATWDECAATHQKEDSIFHPASFSACPGTGGWFSLTTAAWRYS